MPCEQTKLGMATVIEYFNWWIVDDHTGRRCLTTFKLSRADAQRAFPGAEPDPLTREVRCVPDAREALAASRPGPNWS
jgi:hypothetical protein